MLLQGARVPGRDQELVIPMESQDKFRNEAQVTKSNKQKQSRMQI